MAFLIASNFCVQSIARKFFLVVFFVLFCFVLFLFFL